MRICLITPEKFAFGVPLNLAYIAAYLKKYDEEKHDIKIIDEFTGGNAEEDLEKFKPDVVGISATTPQIPRAAEIKNFVKEKYPKVPVIIGGVHTTVIPERTLREGKFDVGVIGEGEVTFFELIQNFKNNGLDQEDLKKIKGICYMKGKDVIFTEPRPLIENLDSMPHPARELLNMDAYLKPHDFIRGIIKRSTFAMFSRGCPYKCVYCSSFAVHKQRFRMNSPEYIIEEIEELINKYGVEAVFFLDDVFIVNKERVRKICELMIDRGYNEKIIWDIQMRANLVSPKDLELFKLLKKAGCIQAEFGFESGSPRMLQTLKKNTVTVEQNHQAIKLCKKAGLRVFGNFMIGSPGETVEDIQMTKKFILEHINDMDEIVINMTIPYPGTEVWDILEKKGLLENLKWNELKWDYQYFFKSPRCFSDTISKEELLNFHRELIALGIKKFSLKVKIKKLLSHPKTVIPLIVPYLYYRLKSTVNK